MLGGGLNLFLVLWSRHVANLSAEDVEDALPPQVLYDCTWPCQALQYILYATLASVLGALAADVYGNWNDQGNGRGNWKMGWYWRVPLVSTLVGALWGWPLLLSTETMAAHLWLLWYGLLPSITALGLVGAFQILTERVPTNFLRVYDEELGLKWLLLSLAVFGVYWLLYIFRASVDNGDCTFAVSTRRYPLYCEKGY